MKNFGRNFSDAVEQTRLFARISDEVRIFAMPTTRMRIMHGRKNFSSETAKTFFEKMKGLMFSGRKNILFVFEKERIFGIHSFFVFFPFDAVYLDGRKKVVEVIQNVKPFTFHVENMIPAKYLLELCEKNNLKVGNKMRW